MVSGAGRRSRVQTIRDGAADNEQGHGLRRLKGMMPLRIPACCRRLAERSEYMEKGKKDDQKRDRYFNSLGLTVVRYSNLEVNQHFDSICEDILRLLEEPSP